MVLFTQEACNDVSRAISAYGHSIQRLAYVYMKNRFDAEDIAQVVFVTYIRKAPQFSSSQKEQAWLDDDRYCVIYEDGLKRYLSVYEFA